MADRFDHQDIERKAQEKWAALDLYRTDLSDTTKDPYYLLFEFPYPSGDLHIGHWYAFAVTDIFARFKRMQGKNVLFPIGFDAFGLPAENAAMKNGDDPRAWTLANIERMRAQIRTMGTSVDWSKEVVTCDPSYYHWTQWLFSKLYEHNLAERKEAAVKWCPKDKTVLANEQVIDGHCDRCGTAVEEKRLTQWFMKITQYAERLLKNLDALPWREEIKDAQRAWIGKSEGAKLSFKLTAAAEAGSEIAAVIPDAAIEVFTTRPDTLYGATYVVLAPEHPLLNELFDVVENEAGLSAYIELTKRKTERERSENKEKTGVRLEGIMAINPVNDEKIPVYVADYVLGSYGTGAVMAVPAHDERDFEFAKKYGLTIRPVVAPDNTDERNPPREGFEMTRRNVVHAIVKNSKGEVLLSFLKGEEWGDLKPVTFVIGGIEEGETALTAAKREIQEETGYSDVVFEQELALITEAKFHQAFKKVNRHVTVKTLVFRLNSDARQAVADEEHAKHDFKWVPETEVAKLINIPDDALAWRYYREGGFAYTGDGNLVNSAEFSGRTNREAFWDIVKKAGGEKVTNYRLRDWLVSRQRYWGCPIPVVYDPEGKPHLVPAEHLPWLLPTDVDFTPNDAGAPLASSKELKKRVTTLFGEGWTPEYDTLDTFVDSSWYFMRYLDSADTHDFSSQSLLKKWLPINRYSGGAEHTTMHLLYSRFFTMALYDLALSPVEEPYAERYNRGLILGPDGAKMSKSKGNVINPDEVVKQHGADAVRIYLAFIGPYNEPGNYPWNLDGVHSMRKFLDRIAALSEHLSDAAMPEPVQKLLAQAEAKAGSDTERFKFNTAISALMVLVRDMEQLNTVPKTAYHDLVRMLAPFAPHLAEALWEKTGGEGSVHTAPWPTYDAALLTEDTVTIGVQVNGKRRGDILIAKDASEDQAVAEARKLAPVEAALGGKAPSRVVYVQGKILNLVA